MKIALRATALLLAAAMAGCLSPADSDGFQRGELARARQAWQEAGVSAYHFDLSVECTGCSAALQQPVRVTVADGATTVVYSQNGQPAPADVFAPYDTVEEIFDVVGDAISRDADILQVGYHPELGYPFVVSAVYDAASGDQLLIQVAALTPAG